MKRMLQWLGTGLLAAVVLLGVGLMATLSERCNHHDEELVSLWTLSRSLEVINPRRFQPPTSSFALTVDPSEINGRGPATYVMRHHDEIVWSEEHPFTLIEVAITAAGETMGYAYSQGVEGLFDGNGYGNVRIVILNSNGKVRLSDATDRVGSHFLHEWPTPVVAGVFLDEDHDRFVVRLKDADINRNIESWWTYQVSTGKKLSETQLTPGGSESQHEGFVIAAKPVADTPLTLVHQHHFQSRIDGDEQIGARFLLVDSATEVVWSLLLPHDYLVKDDAASERFLRNRMLETGAIVSVDQPSQFDLFFAADHQRVSFRVNAAESSGKITWSVVEIGRTPMNVPAVVPSATTTFAIDDERRIVVGSNDPPPTLHLLPPINLRPEQNVTSIRDIYQFTHGGPGRLAFIRDVPNFQFCTFETLPGQCRQVV